VPRKDLHHTHDPLPGERGHHAEDLDQALEELGEFVDVTRDELSDHPRHRASALQRSLAASPRPR
jgi:CBS domain-containing membrane protein